VLLLRLWPAGPLKLSDQTLTHGLAGAVGMVWTEGEGAPAEQPITVTAMATPIPAITRDLRAALVRTVLPPKDPAVTSRPNRQTPSTRMSWNKAILPGALPNEPSL
jgi:hypothetical protein